MKKYFSLGVLAVGLLGLLVGQAIAVCPVPTTQSEAWVDGENCKVVFKYNTDPSKRKIVVKCSGVDPISEAQLGDPVDGTTDYQFCVTPLMAGTATVEANIPYNDLLGGTTACNGKPCWSMNGSSGSTKVQFKDPKGDRGSTTSSVKIGLVVANHNDPKSIIKWIFKGDFVPELTPVGGKLFDDSNLVIFEVINDEGLVVAIRLDSSHVTKNEWNPAEGKGQFKAGFKTGGAPAPADLPDPAQIVARDSIGPDNTRTNDQFPVIGTTGVAGAFSPLLLFQIDVTGTGNAEFQSLSMVAGGDGGCDLINFLRPCHEDFEWHLVTYNALPSDMGAVQSPVQNVIVPAYQITVTDDFGFYDDGVLTPTQLLEFDLSGLGLTCAAPGCYMGAYAVNTDGYLWGILGTTDTAIYNDRVFGFGGATENGLIVLNRGIAYN